MPVRILNFVNGNDSLPSLREKITSLEHEIEKREIQVQSLQLLLERILICLNAGINGETSYTFNDIAGAIVREINVSLILEHAE